MKDLNNKVQVKFNQYIGRITRIFSRPQVKFLRDMIYGILKSGEVKLNCISRALCEDISLKKTSERLGRNLSVEGISEKLNKELSSVNKRDLNSGNSYLILDMSDITKPKAKKMEGLSLVRDGSSGEDEPKLVNGYWLCNVIGIESKDNTIYPLYSELYSLKTENTSENAKIIRAIDVVNENIPKGTWVLDRGGDRSVIIEHLLKEDSSFIIRQKGGRYLKKKDREYSLKEIAKTVKLKYTFRSKTHTFKCGAVQVKYKKEKNNLWLVVSRYKDGGYFYFLCFFPEIFNQQGAAIKAMEGYSKRWSIEEVHKHVKVDFNLEDVRLMSYQSLKNLMPILWTAISFLYVRLKSIDLELIVKSKIKVLVKEKIREISGFIYYKLYKVLKFILNNISIRKIEPFKGLFTKNLQMILEF